MLESRRASSCSRSCKRVALCAFVLRSLIKCEGAMRKRNARTNAKRAEDVDKLRLKGDFGALFESDVYGKHATGNTLVRKSGQFFKLRELCGACEQFRKITVLAIGRVNLFARDLEQYFVPSLDCVGVVVAR